MQSATWPFMYSVTPKQSVHTSLMYKIICIRTIQQLYTESVEYHLTAAILPYYSSRLAKFYNFGLETSRPVSARNRYLRSRTVNSETCFAVTNFCTIPLPTWRKMSNCGCVLLCALATSIMIAIGCVDPILFSVDWWHNFCVPTSYRLFR